MFPSFQAGGDPNPIGNRTIRLQDVPTDRCRVERLKSLPCLPGDILPTAVGALQDTSALLKDFEKFRLLSSQIYFVTLKNVQFVVEPGLDGIVLMDDAVVLETQRFRVYRNARPDVCQNRTIRVDAEVTGRFDSVFLGFDPGWVNYMHWISLNLPKLALADEVLPPETVFALPDYRNYDGVPRPPAMSHGVWKDSLSALRLTPTRTVRHLAPGRYFADELTLTHLDVWPQVALLSHRPYQRAVARLSPPPPGATPGRRIFVSRAAAADTRMPLQDAEQARLDDVLARWGVEKVHLETLSFADQGALFQSAELVIAPHGAGLVNVLFGTPSLKVLELQKRIGPDKTVRSMFFYLAALKGQTYAFLENQTNTVTAADVDAAIKALLSEQGKVL